MLGYLVKMCGDREQAQDLFQETFRRLHEKSHTIRNGNLRPWLFSVATRVAIDSARRKKRWRFLSLAGSDGQETAIPDSAPAPDETALIAERARQVRKALASLPDRQRAAVVMAYYQRMSYSEIAEAMNCSVGAIKSHMFRAMKTLATILPDPSGESI